MIVVLPLHGKKFVITRPENADDTYSNSLQALGAEVINVPTTKVSPVVIVDDVLDDIFSSTYDWLLFTSANAAKFFCQHIKDNPSLDLKFSIAAIGKVTEQVFKENDIHVSFLPSKQSSQIFAEEFNSQVQDARVLWITGNLAWRDFSTTISKKNDIDVVENYKTELIEYSQEERSKFAIQIEGADAVIFFAGSAANGFGLNFANAAKLSSVYFMGERSANDAKEVSFAEVVIPEDSSKEALTEDLLSRFAI